MAIIKVESLKKTFHQRKEKEGLKDAVQDLFRREYRIIDAVKAPTLVVAGDKDVTVDPKNSRLLASRMLSIENEGN